MQMVCGQHALSGLLIVLNNKIDNRLSGESVAAVFIAGTDASVATASRPEVEFTTDDVEPCGNWCKLSTTTHEGIKVVVFFSPPTIE